MDEEKRAPEETRDWDSYTITSDTMFTAVFSDEERARELVEIILGVEVERVVFTHTERMWRMAPALRGVRMDVYLRDRRGTVYDVEMQSYGFGELPKRCRYYQAMIDAESLRKGRPFSELPDSYIIFICTEDPFEEGLARYSFRMGCSEGWTVLEDGRYAIFLNASAEHASEDRAGAFLSYMMGGDTMGDAFVEHVDEAVRFYRQDPEWRDATMHHEEALRYAEEEAHAKGYAIGREEGLEEGLSEGRSQGAAMEQRLARHLFELGRANEYVASLSDPSLHDALMRELGLAAD